MNSSKRLIVCNYTLINTDDKMPNIYNATYDVPTSSLDKGGTVNGWMDGCPDIYKKQNVWKFQQF